MRSSVFVPLAALATLAACSGGPTTPGETVTPPGADFSCLTSQVLSLNVGEVRTGLAGGKVCLTSTGSAEYVVNGFHGSTTGSANTQVTLKGFGLVAPTLASRGLSPSRSRVVDLDGRTPRRSLELAFRAYERNVLASRIAGARAYMRQRANRAIVSPAVGDVVQLNASSTGCEAPIMKSARVVAVTTKAIILADLENPAGGFTDAEYQAIGATFDNSVDPLNRTVFGAPSDIDANERVLIFYTVEVNKLTDPESEGVVEGFFNPRDLFPKTASGTLPACSGSNVAEMFYMVVPDPNGAINGNPHPKEDVQNSTVSVIAHEYQHLINSSRRIYVNDSDDFEEVWLNEGLSHVAEELLFYRLANLAPRSNLDVAAIRTTNARVQAFNENQINNVARYELFLENPRTNSPYADTDELGERGAIWSFLRYAADRKAASDGQIWFDLVNSKTSGMANLRNVFTTDILTWFRDWSISAFTDDKVNTGATWQQPSWDFRDIFPEINVVPFPLNPQILSNATALTESLVGGGSMYVRFGVDAGVTAGVSFTAGSSAATFSVVRVR